MNNKVATCYDPTSQVPRSDNPICDEYDDSIIYYAKQSFDLYKEDKRDLMFNIREEAGLFDEEFHQTVLNDMLNGTCTFDRFILMNKIKYEDKLHSIINEKTYGRWFGSFVDLFIMYIMRPKFMSLIDAHNRPMYLNREQTMHYIDQLNILMKSEYMDLNYVDYYGNSPLENIQLMYDSIEYDDKGKGKACDKPEHIKESISLLTNVLQSNQVYKKRKT